MSNKDNLINPWKDIAAYNISDAYRFKGRDEDIEKFLRIVKEGTMSVLYANSGIGKTSFINAGIIPSLLTEGYFPIHILFPNDALQNDDIEGWLFKELFERVKENELGSNNDFCWVKTIKEEHKAWEQSLWWLLNTYHIYQSSTRKSFRPLIIFDQFEEVFTKSNKERKTNVLENLFKIIGQLCSTSFPKDIEQALDEMYAKGKHVELPNTKQYKVLFSLRKEFLSDFDYWTNDKNAVTELHQNRMFLLPLTRLQAEEVITKQPLSKDDSQLVKTLNPIKNKILDLIDTKHKDEVEPFILSILCSNLYSKAQTEDKEFLLENDIEFNEETLILKFYEENINQIFVNKSHLNRFEESLIDGDGLRNRIKTKVLDSIKFEENYQGPLEKLHLIRIDKYNDENYVELIHDRIADAIKERRKIAKQRKQAKGWNRFWFFVIAALAVWAIRVVTVSPSKSPNYFSDISEYTNLNLTSEDTLAFKKKGHLENSHMVEQLTINDTAAVSINNCSYLKELVLELPRGEQKIWLALSNCPQLRNVIIPDTVKELYYYATNCPRLKLPIGPSVEKLEITTYNSDCSYSFVVNNNNYSWEEAVPYQEGISKDSKQPARKDSTQRFNYTLWDKRDGKLLYAQYNVPTIIHFPRYSNTTWYNMRIGDKEIKNANTENFTQNEQKSQNDTIDVLNVHAEDITNADAEFIFLTDSVKYISPSAFKKCKKLRSIRFSPNIYTIYENAFQGCAQLDSIILPDSLTYISEHAFEGCDNLHYVYFGNKSSLYLCEGAFAKCKNLETIELTGNIMTEYKVDGGHPYFFNPFYDCKKLNNIILKNPETSNLFVWGNIAFAKNDSIPVFIIGSQCDYNQGQFYSYEGSLFERGGKGTDWIWFLADYKHLLLSKDFHTDNGIAFCRLTYENNKKESYIANRTMPKELFLPSSTGRCMTHFVYPPDSLEIMHIPFAQPANHLYSLSFDIPDSLAQRIEIIVPYGCSKYYVNNPNFSSFKAIKEEGFWYSQWNTIKYFSKLTGIFFTSHWWGVPSLFAGCLLLSLLIYFIKKKYLEKRNREVDKKRLITSTVIELVLAVLFYTIFYWFLVGYRPSFSISNNVIAVLLALLLLIIITYGKNSILSCIANLHSSFNKMTRQANSEKDMLNIAMHTNTGKQKASKIAKNSLILISILFTATIAVLDYVQINDINTMLARKDYQRAFNLIYRQALHTDSIDMSMQERMRRILVEMRTIPGLPDSISVSGEKVTVDDDNKVIYVTKNDSVMIFDFKNKKRYVTLGEYTLSKFGNVLYKDEEDAKTFISVHDLSKKYTTNVNTKNWRMMCAERFVALKTDSLLYLYDLENDFTCRTFPLKSASIVWGENENDKYFAIIDRANHTKVYVLPEVKELIYDKSQIIYGFTNNQVISSDRDWERGETHLMNINEFFETTASYHGMFSCMSIDQKSVLFTTDNQNIYWWSLKTNDSFKGFISRSIFQLKKNTTYSSQKFAALRNANKTALKFLNDYSIPIEFGIPLGETNNCLVFSNNESHTTRIVDMENPENPIIIKSAWPEMITSGNNTYLQICNSESKWNSDSTSIYYGQKCIITNRYNNLHLSSDYIISGDWSGEKTFYPINDNNKAHRSIKLDGYFPGQLSIMDGWLIAAWSTNLKVYNFLTLEDLIRECSFYSSEQKEKIISILNKSRI